nr:MAG TPA: hypothetical protein [Bacteriophage sp.]
MPYASTASKSNRGSITKFVPPIKLFTNNNCEEALVLVSYPLYLLSEFTYSLNNS